MTVILNDATLAEQDSTSIGAAVGAIIGAVNVSGTVTNLSVMENMQSVVDQINACVDDYKELSYGDAEAILAIHEGLNNTDTGLAEQM